jgi:hypothetical protein
MQLTLVPNTRQVRRVGFCFWEKAATRNSHGSALGEYSSMSQCICFLIHALPLLPPAQGKPSPPYVNGGWGDKRDHALCMYFAGMGEPPVDLPVLKHRSSSEAEGVGDELQLQPVVPESPRGSQKKQGVLQHLMVSITCDTAAPFALASIPSPLHCRL